jgi:hypothetical protein
VLRGEAAKQLSSVATDGGSTAVVRKDPETATPENVDARAGVATTDICEVVTGYYRSGNEQRRERAEPRLSRARDR